MEIQPDAVPAGPAGALQASARLVRLEAGTYCIFHAAAQVAMPAGRVSGMRITPPPGVADVRVSTFDADGWIGAQGGAALVRVPAHGGAVLVTTYRDGTESADLPGVQVVRLSGPGLPAQMPAPAPQGNDPVVRQAEEGGMVAHIQRRGDVRAALGEWMGTCGSGQWVEGFSIQPSAGVAAYDLEYQAILGQDWFSPWVEGGEYCGSRGMALPVLGLRVRLKGAAVKAFQCHVEASFTDGTRLGPVGDGPVMAPGLAPLEAFRIQILPRPVEQPQPPVDVVEDAAEPAPPVARVRRMRRPVPARAVAPGDRAAQVTTEDRAPWWRRRPARDATAAPVRHGRASGPAKP